MCSDSLRPSAYGYHKLNGILILKDTIPRRGPLVPSGVLPPDARDGGSLVAGGFDSPSAFGLLQTCRLILTQGQPGPRLGERRAADPGQHMPDRQASGTHMRKFPPAVDERSVRKPAPATDTSVYSFALDSRACGDEADGGSFNDQLSMIND